MLAAEVERIRAHIREGLPNVEIQRRMAISASCVSHYRRRMKREGEAVPAPGAGLRYSGARIPDDVRKQVEHHFMQGYGSAKVAELAGVAVNFAKRRRRDLVERLAARGECLPGCDITGRRVAVKESANFITDQQKVDLLWLWMAGWPVAPAARHLRLGLCSAYAIVQQEKDAMVAAGKPWPKTMPPQLRPRLNRPPARKAGPIPRRKPVRAPKAAFPALATPPVILAPQEAPPPAMPQPKPTPAVPPRKRLSFEEQLALVSAGKGTLVPAFKPSRAITEATLGGVGSSML
ncbi:MAG: hypothetical protein WAO77_15100 [Sphingobium sp.]|uniref:hypothetical protein n=1 Tax=Sphingobium sp. TaxID=1912891 RepID=UPI003BB06AF1